MNIVKNLGALIVGPFLFFVFRYYETPFNHEQKTFLIVFATTVYLWLFSNIPLFITGFLSVCTIALLNLADPVDVFSHYAHPIIFLFLGGFLLAEAFNKVYLDKRISLFLLTRKFIKGSIKRLLLTLMILSATFTMWISNTATTAMMLPLVLGILSGLQITNKKITSIILLCMAYASSIGGIATPIGSTPNIIAIGMLSEFVQIKVTFFEWIVYALPITCIFLLVLYFLSIYQFRNYKFNMDTSYLEEEYLKLPKISISEKCTFFIFMLTVLAWLAPSFFKLLGIKSPLSLNAGVVAIFGASLLFIFPLSTKEKILQQRDIKSIDWSSLLLFGSGLALGKVLFNLQLAEMAGSYMMERVSGLPLFFIFLIMFMFVIFSTELTSNTATANIILPIMISLASEMQISAFFLSMGIAISCSMAFMLPIATPPNAIVYGSEKVDKKDMITLGLGLNLLFSILLALYITFLESNFKF